MSLDHPPVAYHPDMPSQYAGTLQGLSDNKVNSSRQFSVFLVSPSGSLESAHCLVL